MGFRHDMRGKAPRIQEIVRKRDKEDERLRQTSNKESDIVCIPSLQQATYAGVCFQKDGQNILELRVSLPATLSESCGLLDTDVHEWLCKTGRTFINEVVEYEVLMISAADVSNKKMTTGWKNLNRVKN